MKPHDDFQNPTFRKHMDLFLKLNETLGEDHPETIRAFQLSLAHAPQSLQDAMHEKAKELDLLPEKPVGKNARGENMYSLEEIAGRLGISMEEAIESVESLIADREALGLSNDGVIRLPADGQAIKAVH